jgi:hypothetical protein
VLKSLGVGAVTAGTIGTASAQPKDRGLRLFSEQAVDGAAEVVTQKGHAYVARNDGYGANASGMAVVDWKRKDRPETVAEVVRGGGLEDTDDLAVEEVKLDGDVAGRANHTESPGGAAFL